MNAMNRWILGVVLALLVFAVATCGTDAEKAWANGDVTASEPIDLSGVDWVGLARLIHGKCGEYHDLAIAVGWTEKQWAKLSFVMNRESRCNTMSYNRTDPNGGSRGLIQINGFWCRPSRYNKNGWLQEQGILSTCDDLYNPEVNLRAGLAMWNYSQQRNGCGWRPWATRC